MTSLHFHLCFYLDLIFQPWKQKAFIQETFGFPEFFFPIIPSYQHRFKELLHLYVALSPPTAGLNPLRLKGFKSFSHFFVFFKRATFILNTTPRPQREVWTTAALSETDSGNWDSHCVSTCESKCNENQQEEL